MNKIVKATRIGVRPLIGLYSESGCGKTYSSLLLARGFVGPEGKIVMIDTESGRGSLYADVLPGGYDVLQITEPFSSRAFVEAIRAVEESGAAIGIIDGASHEWEGIGGVLDQAGEIEQKTGKPGLHCWKTPKLEHAKMMLKLLQSSIPWIVCLRAKHKSRQVKDERGKSQIIKDDFTTPIQDDGFIFEMTIHGEIMADHSFRMTKASHPELARCFEARKPITGETGRRVAMWCEGKPIGKPAQAHAEREPDPFGMDDDTVVEPPQKPAPAQRKPPAASARSRNDDGSTGTTITGVIADVVEKSGMGKDNKPWTRWGVTIKVSDDESFIAGTFDKAVGEMAAGMVGVEIEAVIKRNGKFINLLSFEEIPQ